MVPVAAVAQRVRTEMFLDAPVQAAVAQIPQHVRHQDRCGVAAGFRHARMEQPVCGIAGIFEVGWFGTITTGLGQGMELTVIAAAVIGGANLSGGIGTAFGAVDGAALIEIIRNGLTLLGISTFWQATFVGTFIVVAVLFDRLRSRASSD